MVVLPGDGASETGRSVVAPTAVAGGPNGNIAGPEWQYRVAPQASEYSLTANTDVATAKLPSNTNLARSTSVMGSV